MYDCRPTTGVAIFKTVLMTYFWLMGKFNLEEQVENTELNWFLYIFFIGNMFFMNIIMLNFLLAIIADTF